MELLLLDSARVILAPGIVFKGYALLDTSTGACYPLNDSAKYILELCSKGSSVEELELTIANYFNINRRIARRDLNCFLCDLHSHGLLSIRQSFLLEATARIFLRLINFYIFISGVGEGPYWRCPNRRYPSGVRWILVACLEAHQVTIMLVGAVALVSTVIAALASRQPWLETHALAAGVLLSVTYIIGLIGSIILHELSHYWVARHLGIRVASVFARMGVVGMTREESSVARSVIVTLAGPGVTIFALGFVLLGISYLTKGREFFVMLIFCLSIIIFHMASLTPLSMEGRYIWHLMRLTYRRGLNPEC